MKMRVFCACCVIAIYLGGCASPSAITTQSGFMSDYSRLQSDDGGKSASYKKDGFELKNYGKISFAPTKVHLSQTLIEESGLEEGQQQEIAELITQYLNDAFTRGFHGQGHKSLQVRSAVSGVSSSSEDLKAYQYIPVALAVTGAMEAAGARAKNLVIFLEAEAIDEASGEVVASKVRGVDLGKVSSGDLNEDPIGAIKPLLKEWADNLAADVSGRLE